MILEAFAEYLHEADPELHSRDVLANWLLEKLSIKPESSVDKVIQLEIELCQGQNGDREELEEEYSFAVNGSPKVSRLSRINQPLVFKGASKSGNRLLKSLEEYSQSYENQKWARWAHEVKASDFKKRQS